MVAGALASCWRACGRVPIGKAMECVPDPQASARTCAHWVTLAKLPTSPDWAIWEWEPCRTLSQKARPRGVRQCHLSSVRGVAQDARRLECLSPTGTPEVPFCAPDWAAPAAVLARRSVRVLESQVCARESFSLQSIAILTY